MAWQCLFKALNLIQLTRSVVYLAYANKLPHNKHKLHKIRTNKRAIKQCDSIGFIFCRFIKYKKKIKLFCLRSKLFDAVF